MAYEPKILKILKYPDDILHQVAVSVTTFNQQLEEFVADMTATMIAGNGIGLAAPQVGNLIRVITIGMKNETPFVLINPDIISASEQLFDFREGCLSVPGYFEDRQRPRGIRVRFHDTKGHEYFQVFSDLCAFCIQHEIDHLDGKLFVDELSDLKKSRIKEKIKKKFG